MMDEYDYAERPQRASFRGNRPSISDYHVYRPLVLRTPVGPVRVYSKPGIYSWNRLDRAASLILRALRYDGLPARSRVLDLGCGNGAIGFGLLRMQPEIDLHLTDASHAAYTATAISLDRLGLAGRTWFGDVTADMPDEMRFDVVVAGLPRGRLLAEQFLREAWRRLEPGGRFYIAGARNTGIATRIDTLQDWFGKVDRLGSIAGYRVARAVKVPGRAPPPPSDYHEWRAIGFAARGRQWRYVSKPGVFSWDHTDAGTSRLLESLQVHAGESVLDLGCGSGQVGLVAAAASSDVSVTMLDDSLVAVRAAERTAALNGIEATVIASDAAGAVIGKRFDVVATNPPFHSGPETEYGVATQFIEDARDVLEAKGRLYLVANAFIAYDKQMEAMFRRVGEIHSDDHFRVMLGERPLGRCKDRPKPPVIAEARPAE